MTVRAGSVLALAALAFGGLDCAVYSDGLLGAAGAEDLGAGSGAGGSPANASQGGNSGSTVSSAGGNAVAGGGDVGLGSAGDDSSTAGNGGDAGNPSGGMPALGGMTSGGGAGTGGSAGKGGTTASGGGSSGSAGKGGSAGAGGAAGAAGVGNTAGTGGSAGSAGSGGTGGSTGGCASGSCAGASGAGGSGGSTGVPMCSDHVLTAKATWAASASTFHVGEPASLLIDNTTARWSTGIPQAGTEWIQIDFGAVVTLRMINLQQGNGADANDYPRSYAVIVSNISKDLTGTVRATGVGTNTASTTITLSGVFSGRYLLIKQVGTSLSWWSVEEVEVSCFD